MAIQAAEITYAQRDADGCYWWAIGEDEIHRGGTDADGLARQFAAAACHVHLFGFREHSPLVEVLADAAVPVSLASPRLAATVAMPRDPDQLLVAAHRVDDRAGSMGGWQRLGEREFATHRLVNALESGRDFIPILARHPAMLSWDFVGPLHWRKLALAVAAIRDPRWFIDYANPDRNAALRSYFGLCRLQTAATAERYRLLWDSWATPGSLFAQEHARRCGAGVAVAKSVAVTNRRFLKFLAGTWINALSRTPRPATEQAAWDARPFFDDDVAAAYAAYVARR